MSEEEARQKKLRQIRALLDKADVTTFPEEADALRAKADDLMLAYAIQEHEVEMAKPKNERKPPTMRQVNIVDAASPVRDQMLQLISAIASHSRCRIVFYGSRNKTGQVSAKLVGFPSDIDYVEMLFTSLRVQMSSCIDPKPDPNMTEIENIVMLKEAGVKWERIWNLLFPEEPWNPKCNLFSRYRSYCKEHGREPHNTAPITYIRNFADGYVQKITRRLFEIREAQQTVTTGKDLVLYDRKKEVEDLFRQTFPKLGVVRYGKSKFDISAQNKGRTAAANADLGQNRVAKRKELA